MLAINPVKHTPSLFLALLFSFGSATPTWATCRGLEDSHSQPLSPDVSAVIATGHTVEHPGKGMILPTNLHERVTFFQRTPQKEGIAVVDFRENAVIFSEFLPASTSHPVLATAISPKGDQMVLVTNSGAKIVALGGGKPDIRLPVEIDERFIAGTNKIQWSPDGTHVAIFTAGKSEIAVFKNDGTYVTSLLGKEKWFGGRREFLDFTWNPEGTRMATTDDSSVVTIFPVVPAGTSAGATIDPIETRDAGFLVRCWGVLWPTSETIATKNAGPEYTVWNLRRFTRTTGTVGLFPMVTKAIAPGAELPAIYVSPLMAEVVQLPRHAGEILYIDGHKNLVYLHGGGLVRKPLTDEQTHALQRWTERG